MSTLDPRIRRYVDETGVLLERGGLPRIAGQVLGLLQVCDPETVSLPELAESLGISRASASTSARLLEQIGIVERAIRAGDRRDYYRISHDAWHRFFQTRFELMRRLRQNADLGLRMLEGESPQRQHRLERMRRLYAFLEREMPKLLERFEVEEGDERTAYVGATVSDRPR